VRIVLSGGGTAGHIYPALTVADRLRDDGHEVHLVGTATGPEARLAREAGLVFHALPARGFDRSRPLSLIGALAVLAISTLRATLLLGRVRPAVVAGFGGYVSIQVGLAAVARRIPIALHEQNSVIGMANKLLSRWACTVAVTYPDTVAQLRAGVRSEVTGNPVREGIVAADRAAARRDLGAGERDVIVLAFGGSRGARHINEAMAELRSELLERIEVRVLHVAGPTEAADVRARIAGDGSAAEEDARYRVFDYLEDMGSALAAADIVIARAGATSIAEITAVGRAAVLVPYPYATDDHQTSNAADVAAVGGATVVSDAELDTPRFADAVLHLVDDTTARAQMADASKTLGRPDAGQRLAAAILSCARTRTPRAAR